MKFPVQYFYTVRPGDSLYRLAGRLGLTLENIISSNQIADPNHLFIGQQLSIPLAQIPYRVKPGDTLYRISQVYGVPVESIIESNQLQSPYIIYPDQTLYIPPGLPYYTVKLGDTLSQIARTYNSSVSLIQAANELTKTMIYPGMRLMIPYPPPSEPGLIAYISNQSGFYDLWIYNPGNGAHQKLTNQLADTFSVPYWSHDGENIAFVGRNYLINVLNQSDQRLSQIDQLSEEDVYTLDWSPNNHVLAYTKNNDIILYNMNTHEATRITKTLPRDVQWFNDGTHILYSALDPNGFRQMFQLNLENNEDRQLTFQQPPVNYLRISPDSEFALFTSPGASISIIHTVEVNTGNMFGLEGGPLAKNYYPIWSKDSTQLAYSATDFSNERGYFSHIKTVGRRGENDQTWAYSDCFATPISWSTSGESLVYLSGCRETAFANSAWFINLRNPAPIKLFEVNGQIVSISWSPK